MTNFQTSAIKQLANITVGGTPSTTIPIYWGGNIPWMASGDVHLKRIKGVSGRITLDGLNASNATLVPPSSIAIALAGQGKTRGTVALVEIELCTNQSIALIKTDESRLLSGFLFHLLDSQYENLRASSAGGGRAGLSKGILENYEISYPPIDEQKAITRILDTIDEAIAAAEAQLAKQEKIKQGLLQDLLTRGIDETGQIRPHWEDRPDLYKKSELGWIPSNWEIKQLYRTNIEIIDGDRGANYPHHSEFSTDGFCLFLSTKNVAKNGFSFKDLQFITDEKDQKLGNGKLSRNDIVITTRGTVGNIAFYNDEVAFENIRINSGMLIIRNKEKKLNTKFLYNSYREFIFGIEFKKLVSGSAQPQLPVKDFCNFNVLMPIDNEQEIINKLIDEINLPIRITSEEIVKLKKLKTGLMQDLLTGQRRVTPELIRQVETLADNT